MTTGAVLSVAVLCCRSPSESSGDLPGQGERVPLGQTIEHDVAGGATRVYSFAGAAASEYAVFLEATRGAVQLLVVDSAAQRTVASVSASAGGYPLDENATPRFPAQDDCVYHLRVSALPADSSAQFRFLVHRVNPNPEQRAQQFTIGDTVSGETIDPMVDVDEFLVHGEAGQEIVVVMEALAPAGTGSVGAFVMDSVGSTPLGSVFAYAGERPTHTSGRLRLPVSGSYRLKAQSVLGNPPRYRGAYRFWTYAVNRAPERLPAELPFYTEVSGEAIDRAGDVDEFMLQASAGMQLNAFLVAPRPFALEVVAPDGTRLGDVMADPDSSVMRGTGRLGPLQPGTHLIRVLGALSTQVADTGRFRVLLYVIDPRPEAIAADVLPGDTVSGEAIDVVGDVDEFTFQAARGQEFNVFLQCLSGSPDVIQSLDVVDADGTPLGHAGANGAIGDLFGSGTGRFAIHTTGTHQIRVAGALDDVDRDLGPYRFLIYPVDRRPETLPDTLILGDSLSGEALDLPGDLDEFHVSVADMSGANLALEGDSGVPQGVMRAELIDVATSQPVMAVRSGGAGQLALSGRTGLPPGAYLLRVGGYQDWAVRGPYRLWLYRFGFGPELVPDTIAVGDTVSGEVLEPLGDEDVFHFHGTKGQHLNLAIQGIESEESGGFEAFLTYGGLLVAVVSGPGASGALTDLQTLRLDLPASGWYEVSVSGGGVPETVTDRGAYRMALMELGTAPEQVGGNVVPGDSVVAEAIDEPGDWDEYTLTALPNQDLGVVFQSTASAYFPHLVVFDSASGDSLAGTVAQGLRLAGPFRMPLSGRVRVAVFEPPSVDLRMCHDATCGGIFGYVGGYRFEVIPINRAPENVPASYAAGDTVRGEAISPAGDIDEYTSTGTPGDTLTVWYRLTADPVPSGSLIALDIIDPATGMVLVGAGKSLIGSSVQFHQWGRVVVPSGGSYVIRVHAVAAFGEGSVGTAPYEFLVTR